MLNPPTIQPLIIAMNALPYRWSGFVWIGLNIAGTLGLVELSRRVLNQMGGIAGRSIPPEATAGLMAAVALSTGARMGLELGQLQVVLAVALLGALWAQALGRPVVAGLLLAIATVKPQTMVPFLILFLRRSDVVTWATLAVVAPLMIITTTPPDELIARIWSWQACVRNNFGPGMVNDISYTNPSHHSLVSLGQVLYGLGMRDLGLINTGQSLLVLMLGLALLYKVAWRKQVARPAACALVGCYTMLFLYHRSYDTVFLALPLTYAAAAARRSSGVTRALFATAGVAVLVAMNSYTSVELTLLEKSWKLGLAGRLIQALIIPYLTYAVLIALGTLWFAARLQNRQGIEDRTDDVTLVLNL
jgi:hypothetical protein